MSIARQSEKPYQTTLTSILSLQGRGSKIFLLPWREKARMRGTSKLGPFLIHFLVQYAGLAAQDLIHSVLHILEGHEIAFFRGRRDSFFICFNGRFLV